MGREQEDCSPDTFILLVLFPAPSRHPKAASHSVDYQQWWVWEFLSALLVFGGERVRSPLSCMTILCSRAQEESIVMQETKVWSTMEYHCIFFFPLEGFWKFLDLFGTHPYLLGAQVSTVAPRPLPWWGIQGVDVFAKTPSPKEKI